MKSNKRVFPVLNGTFMGFNLFITSLKLCVFNSRYAIVISANYSMFSNCAISLIPCPSPLLTYKLNQF